MNRIYLKKCKKDSFWIKDILDDKKIGKIKCINDEFIIKIKSKLKAQFIESEALVLLDDTNMAFIKVYGNYINQYCKDLVDINGYDFPMFAESCRLKQCEDDMFDRPAFLHPAVKKAWDKMKKAAQSDRIDLQIISAYRSMEYQQQLIKNKIAKGISIKNILKTNTLPGFSEHHTGCAIDVGSKDAAVLEEGFDQSPAYNWLTKHANKFKFYLSYPKENNTGIIYEPWHWCYRIE